MHFKALKNRGGKLLTGLMLSTLLGGLSTAARAQAPAAAPGGTTLIDRIQPLPGELRTLPILPVGGAFGLMLNKPEIGAQGAGVRIEKPGQAVVFPTVELLAGPVGTIQFFVTPGADPVDAAANRVLLDTLPVAGPSRILVSLTGTKLTLSYTDDAGAVKTIEGTVNWPASTPQRVTVLWDATDMSLVIGNATLGKIEAPKPMAREPLAVVLGNSRDFKSPALLTVSSLRLSTARELVGPVNPGAQNDTIPVEELTLRMAQGYQRRLYPLLERLRQVGVVEVNYAYALAYSDIGDVEKALQTVTPITKEINSPLYVPAVFLRSDLLVSTNKHSDAYEQLQVLASSKDIPTSVRAQVKQASVLFEQGNTAESKQLISDILARYDDIAQINDAYLMIGLERFKQGDFQSAYRAFRSIGIPGAPPQQSVAIGTPLQIKVADADLNARVSDIGLQVIITATSGDKEVLMLKPSFSRGVYIGSVETSLGAPKAGDLTLQVQGDDKIQMSYIDKISEEGANIQRTFGMTLATNGEVVVLAQSALDVYREVKKYQKLNLLDNNWVVQGDLPKTATEFFRDPETGLLRPRGYRFAQDFITNIKQGQSVYVEVNEPDEDRTNKVDTIQLDITTQGGKKMPVTLTESGTNTGVFSAIVKTTPDDKPQAGLLDVSTNDVITANYKDARPAAGTKDGNRLSKVTIRSAAGTIAAGIEVLNEDAENGKSILRVYRVSGNNTPLIVQVADRDLDIGDTPDKVTVTVRAESGAEVPLTLTESGNHTGQFNGTIKISSEGLPGALKVKQGDQITLLYVDDDNPSKKPENREYQLRANIAESATWTFSRQIITYPKIDSNSKSATQPPPIVTWEETKTFVPGFVHRIRLVDPDVIPTKAGDFDTEIKLKATNGATVTVPLRGVVDASRKETRDFAFGGDFFVRLGDKSSPERAFFSQTGSVVDIDEEKAGRLWSVPSIAVQGKDKVELLYTEPLTGDAKRNVARTDSFRVAADGEVALLNERGNKLEKIKPGMSFDLEIRDANGDLTDKRDTISALVTSSNGDTLNLKLQEKERHSNVFLARVKTAFGATAKADEILDVPFDGKITVKYMDDETIVGTAAERLAELTTRPLGDADGILLTKIYEDAKFEVETLVRLGESLYAVGAAELNTNKPKEGMPRTNAKLQDATRIMEQIIKRFPTSEYVVESLFLTAKVRREEKNFEVASDLYKRVIDEYPDSEFVPQALYQLVLLNYDQGNIDEATESAMHLVYGFSKNPLVADAFLRIAEYYYNKKEYLTAAFIYKRVIDRFPDNARIELISYRMATSYYRAGLAQFDDPKTTKDSAKTLAQAVRYFIEFSDTYKDHELADDALYWAANASMKQGLGVRGTQRAYTLLTRQLITYLDGDMKTFATRLRDKIKEENPTMEAEPG